MHVVVVGCGRVGSELAVSLERLGHTVAVIDKNAGRVPQRLPESFTGQKIVGFGFDRDHLVEAGIERAGALAAVTSGDNSNILAARIARENFAIERVVARINDPRRAADLPAPRHPDRGHRLVDHRPGDAPAAAERGAGPRVARPERQGRACSTTRSRRRWAGKKLAAPERTGRVLARGHHPPRRTRR